jgi:hypothetical protein
MIMVDEANGETDELTPDAEAPDPEDDQPMSFGIFVLSLNASALIHLGDSPEEGGLNLPLARQTIDILSMLEGKTRGNLSGEEERLLHQILFDLRLRYSRRAGS